MPRGEHKEDDIFCKIVKGEVPCYKIYEDEDVLAFLDLGQTTRGHTLVISKEHYDNFLSCPKEIMHKVMDIAQRVGQIQIKMLGAEGVNILSNCYEAAGQSVFHFHVHVIPRYNKEDGLRIEMRSQDANELNLPSLVDMIRLD